jgi:D-threo-aldose 1-dehydrogenase
MFHDDVVRLRTGLEISRFGLGTATLGGLYTSISDEDANSTVSTALNCGVTYIDTAPHYGKGSSERRLAKALAGKTGFHLSTKIGRILIPAINSVDPDFADTDTSVVRSFDYSASGVERSIKESLERLEMDHVDIVYIHDPDDEIYIEQSIKEAYPALEKMRDQGLIKAIGVGMNQSAVPTRFVNETDIDMVLIAGRFTLLDQSAERDLLPAALKRGVDVIAAGVLNSGILANPVAGARYDYAPASQEILERAQKIKSILDKSGVSIMSAALQFPLRHPSVKAVLVGCRNSQEVLDNTAAFDVEIPEDVWQDLAQLSEIV